MAGRCCMRLLLRAEDAVAGIAQTGHDVAVLVQVIVQRTGIDVHIRVQLLDVFDALGSRHQFHQLDVLAAALLHDCVEDTAATDEEIRKLFGDEIAELVAGVTKLDKIKFKSKEERERILYKNFVQVGEDVKAMIKEIQQFRTMM